MFLQEVDKKILIGGLLMKISSKNLFCFIIMFISILFRYLSPWQVVSQSQRYYLLPFVFILLLIYLFNLKIKKEKYLFIIIVMIFGTIDFIITKEIDVFMSLLLAFIYLFDDGDKLFIKHFFISSCILYILTIVMVILNIIQNVEFVRLVNNNLTIRNSLGFVNPNHAFTFLTPIIITFYLKLKNSDKNKWYLLLILLINFLIFMQTDSRTGFYSIIIFVIFIFFDNIIKKIMSPKFKYIYIVMTIVSIVIALLWGYKGSFLNNVLTNRPVIWNRHVTKFPIKLFGNSNALIDNCYLWLIYRHGLIMYLFYFVIYYKSTSYFLKNKKLFISFLIVMIYSLFENTVNYAFNPMFILGIIYCLNGNTYRMCLLNEKLEEQTKNDIIKVTS